MYLKLMLKLNLHFIYSKPPLCDHLKQIIWIAFEIAGSLKQVKSNTEAPIGTDCFIFDLNLATLCH